MNSKAKQSIGQRSREAGCSYQHEGCFHPIRIVSIKDKTCNTINIYLFIFFSSIITIVNSCLIKTSTEKEEDGPHLGSQQINRQKNCFSGFTSLTYLSELTELNKRDLILQNREKANCVALPEKSLFRIFTNSQHFEELAIICCCTFYFYSQQSFGVCF